MNTGGRTSLRTAVSPGTARTRPAIRNRRRPTCTESPHLRVELPHHAVVDQGPAAGAEGGPGAGRVGAHRP